MATQGRSGSSVTMTSAGLEPDGSKAWGIFTVDRRPFDGWEVEALVDSSGVLFELAISPAGPTPPANGITRRMVQGLPVGAIHQRLLRGFREALEAAASGASVPLTAIDDEGRQHTVGEVQASQEMKSMLVTEVDALRGERLVVKAQLARDYVAECVRGGRPLADFARDRNYSPSTISNRISSLRSEGYLPKLAEGEKNPGKPWGSETQKTLDILAAVGERKD